jgi:hypothetical protein
MHFIDATGNGSTICNDFLAFCVMKADSYAFARKRNIKNIQAYSTAKISTSLME